MLSTGLVRWELPGMPCNHSNQSFSILIFVLRHLFATLSVAPSREFFPKALKIFQEEVGAIKHVPGLVPNFISYPLQRNAIKAMKQRGGNALGIDRDEPLFCVLNPMLQG